MYMMPPVQLESPETTTCAVPVAHYGKTVVKTNPMTVKLASEYELGEETAFDFNKGHPTTKKGKRLQIHFSETDRSKFRLQLGNQVGYLLHNGVDYQQESVSLSYTVPDEDEVTKLEQLQEDMISYGIKNKYKAHYWLER